MSDFRVVNHRLIRDDKLVAWVPTVNKSGVIKPEYIVLHDTASPLSVQGDIDWLSGKTGNRGSSAHFVVARNGTVTQLADCNARTWHAGASKWAGRSDCNSFCIGIEIDNPGKVERVGTTDTYRSYYGSIKDDAQVDFAFAETKEHGRGYWAFYTEQQIDSVVGMCSAIVRAYDIKDIITHYLISPGRKVDVNPLFPLQKVRERVFGLDNKPPQAKPLPFVPDATVMVNDLNLRGTPNGAIIGAYDAGTRVDVQSADRVGNWLRVITSDGKSGYMYASYIRMDGEVKNGVV